MDKKKIVSILTLVGTLAVGFGLGGLFTKKRIEKSNETKNEEEEVNE